MVVFDKNNFEDFVQTKSLNANLSLDSINELIKKYPTFHSLYLIKSLVLKKQNAPNFDQALPPLATNVRDRSILHDALHQSNFVNWVTTVAEPLVFQEKIVETTISGEEQLVEQPIQKEALGLTEEKGSTESEIIGLEQENVEEELVVENDQELSYGEWLKRIRTTVSSDVEHVMHIDATSANEALLMKEVSRSEDVLESFVASEITKKRQHKKEGIKKAKNKLLDNNDFVTESLAEIYMVQQKYDKAVATYEALSLKYPQKSSYFARQIEKLKNKL